MPKSWKLSIKALIAETSATPSVYETIQILSQQVFVSWIESK